MKAEKLLLAEANTYMNRFVRIVLLLDTEVPKFIVLMTSRVLVNIDDVTIVTDYWYNFSTRN